MNENILRLKEYLATHRAVATISIVGLVLLITLGVVIATDAYPIAFVNGKPVSADRYIRNYHAAKVFYANIMEQVRVTTSTINVEIPSDNELRAEVLDGLIAEELLIRGAKQELGSEYDRLVAEKVSQHADDAALRDSVMQLYGMSYEEFRDEVLVPQAAQDAFASRIYLAGNNFEAWLEEARRSARVTILSARFSWNGDRIVVVE